MVEPCLHSLSVYFHGVDSENFTLTCGMFATSVFKMLLLSCPHLSACRPVFPSIRVEKNCLADNQIFVTFSVGGKNIAGVCLKTQLGFTSVLILYFSHDEVHVFFKAFMGTDTTTNDTFSSTLFLRDFKIFQANAMDRRESSFL